MPTPAAVAALRRPFILLAWLGLQSMRADEMSTRRLVEGAATQRRA